MIGTSYQAYIILTSVPSKRPSRGCLKHLNNQNNDYLVSIFKCHNCCSFPFLISATRVRCSFAVIVDFGGYILLNEFTSIMYLNLHVCVYVSQLATSEWTIIQSLFVEGPANFKSMVLVNCGKCVLHWRLHKGLMGYKKLSTQKLVFSFEPLATSWANSASWAWSTLNRNSRAHSGWFISLCTLGNSIKAWWKTFLNYSKNPLLTESTLLPLSFSF